MKRLLSLALSLKMAAAILLVPGRAQAQTVEMKPCTTYAVAGGAHIADVAGTTPINWLLMALLLRVETDTECTPKASLDSRALVDQ